MLFFYFFLLISSHITLILIIPYAMTSLYIFICSMHSQTQLKSREYKRIGAELLPESVQRNNYVPAPQNQ